MKGSHFIRSQKMTIIVGILSIVILIVVLQLWLFTATMDAALRGESGILVPVALASFVCLLLNVGLLWYVYRLDE